MVRVDHRLRSRGCQAPAAAAGARRADRRVPGGRGASRSGACCTEEMERVADAAGPLDRRGTQRKKLADSERIKEQCSVKIVPMTADHLEALEQLERICFSAPVDRARCWPRSWRTSCAAFLVAEDSDSGRVLGYAGLQVVADEGYITNVAVCPELPAAGRAQRSSCRLFLQFAAGESSGVSDAGGAAEPTPRPSRSIRRFGFDGGRAAARTTTTFRRRTR